MAGAAKRLEWAPRARHAYLASIAYIAAHDPRTASLVIERVERALDLILEHPEIGVANARRGERRYPIANTAHASFIA
jgi:plasmid stabilization system protein ParE